MKKISLLFSLLLLTFIARSQNGLECVEVEVYYVSDANDTNANSVGGILPIGSVTYRVYANLLQGYKFQAGFGVDSVPIGGPLSPGDHELRLETTTMFFNNEDRGATQPTYTKTQARTNTVMLDTWFSAGAGCVSNYGIMKADDDGVSTVVNNFVPMVLQNNNAFAGIPLTLEDGLIAGTPEVVTFVGFTTPELDVVDNTQAGNLISTFNASWASLNGSKGADTVDNKVLIGQFTTDGTFSFKLNIQIGTPTGGVQKYVAENPVANEIMLPCLTFNSDSLTVGIPHHNSPAASGTFSVYPNPANDFVTVTFNQKNSNAAYTLIDMAGKIVQHKELSGIMQKKSERVGLSALAPGIYILQLNADGITSHKKIIKN